MNTIERLTITLPPEMAEAVRRAVAAGEYASSSEVVREALRDWRHKRALQRHELAELRAQVQRGIDDLVGFSFSLREGGKRIKRRRVEFMGRPK